MAGVPPLLGFFSKQFVLYSAMDSGYYFMGIVAILVSVISAFYYLKIIKIIYSPSHKATNIESTNNLKNLKITNAAYSAKYNELSILSNAHSFIIGTLTISIMIFILNPELLLNSIAIITSLILNL